MRKTHKNAQHTNSAASHSPAHPFHVRCVPPRDVLVKSVLVSEREVHVPHRGRFPLLYRAPGAVRAGETITHGIATSQASLSLYVCHRDRAIRARKVRLAVLVPARVDCLLKLGLKNGPIALNRGSAVGYRGLEEAVTGVGARNASSAVEVGAGLADEVLGAGGNDEEG